MPTPHHLKNMGVYANRYRLAEAAAQGLLLSLRCLRCRRSPVVFLASDLVQVLDPNRDCFVPAPFPCSHCGSDRFVEVKLRPQEEAAVGKLMVRRLAGIRKVAVWRNEFLGDRPSQQWPEKPEAQPPASQGDRATSEHRLADGEGDDQYEHRDHDEDVEEDFGNAGGGGRDSGEAEEARDDRDHEEDEGPLEHG